MLVLTSFFLFTQSNSIDFHLHDTYFIVANTHIFWFLGTIAFIIWTLYLVTNKILFSKTLTWIHIIISILTILLLILSLYFRNATLNTTARRYYDFSNWDSLDNYTTFTKVFGKVLLILILGQLLFFINLVMGLLKPKKK
jgi:heme/copper-type cytochrome/quinol oxidase subunit 1